MKASLLSGLLALWASPNANAYSITIDNLFTITTANPVLAARQAASATTTSASSTYKTPDPWQCATQNMTKFYDFPKPTGVLQSALYDYGNSWISPCLKTATGSQGLYCRVPDSAWCAFSTKAPANATAAYTTFAKSVATWWNAQSSAAVSASRFCPDTFGRFNMLDRYQYNFTTNMASCYLKVSPFPSSVSGTTTSTGTSSKPTSSTGSTSNTSKPTTSTSAVTSSTSKPATTSTSTKAK